MELFRYVVSTAILIAIGGCASPSFDFPRTPVSVVKEHGVTYSLFVADDKVQVVRTGFASKERRRTIESEMRRFVAREMRCEINPDTIRSDSVVMTGDLAC